MLFRLIFKFLNLLFIFIYVLNEKKLFFKILKLFDTIPLTTRASKLRVRS